MALPINLLQARRRLRTSIEQQQLLLMDDIAQAKRSSTQLRSSIARSAASPAALGVAALVGFLSGRKWQSPSASHNVMPEHAQPRQSTLLPLLINLMTPTLIGWIADRLLPLLHRQPANRNEANPEPGAPEPWR